jgi:DNA-binding MarR family transcriptional regulator
VLLVSDKGGVVMAKKNSTTPLADRLVAVMRVLRVSSSRSEIAGISNARYEFLHALAHAGPTRMSALARHLDISPRTVTPMVDSLERDGLVARAPDPTDRRAQVLSLTPDGVELMRRAHHERVGQVERLFEPLDSAERATLAALLDKVLDASERR